DAATSAAGCDAIVNLAGESIAQRWSSQVKRRIEASRVEQPRRFLQALATQPSRTARTYVSASAIGYYGDSETATFTEDAPPGDDFLARVCAAWEREALTARDLGMRVAILRTGIALGTDGGALEKILPPFRAGAGGPVGNGKQWWSWIHIDDLVAIYLLALERIDGAVNATAPEPVTNAEFTATLGDVLHRPAKLPVPAFALKMMLGEGASFVLKGQRVVPHRLSAEYGFTFAYPALAPALRGLL
ncbi:MAG: TIGR01777 family oxidoreductase, partial [Candidatus Eremiobacteraeota bacterium]|nr:TIGR01777 family oxidoreductase [Candidatus Eremiobacteraeota bacterium]